LTGRPELLWDVKVTFYTAVSLSFCL